MKSHPILRGGALAGFAAAVLASSVSPSFRAAAASHEKDASRYCPSRLDAAAQTRVYSRIMNLGASYSHGCTMCDADEGFRANTMADGQFNFARRNFLARFLHRAAWKNPAEWRFEFMSVLENDYASNLAEIYPKKDLRRDGYDGKWALWPDLDKVERLTPELEEWVRASPGFRDEGALVGNGLVRRNYRQRDMSRTGHAYQTVPGRYAAEGARQKRIFDLAIDRARSFEMLRAYGGKETYDKLAKGGWRDPLARERLVRDTVAYLRSFEPSIVFSVDSLFWDAVPRMFHYARLEKPDSLVTRLITLPLVSRLMGLDLYDETQQANMSEDYYRVLTALSRGSEGGAPVPVLLGRLIDHPGRAIKDLGLEAEFGALIGTFIEVFSGRDFTEEMTAQLRRLSYGNDDAARIAMAFDGTPVDTTDGISLRPAELARVRAALSRAEAIEVRYREGAPTAMTAGNGVKPSLPWAVRGAMNAAILDALGDLPLLVKAADKAFAYGNGKAREVAARTDNNVQLVNVDSFYRNFHTIVNEHTMHPTTEGAVFMADLVETALCESVGPNP